MYSEYWEAINDDIIKKAIFDENLSLIGGIVFLVTSVCLFFSGIIITKIQKKKGEIPSAGVLVPISILTILPAIAFFVIWTETYTASRCPTLYLQKHALNEQHREYLEKSYE